MKPLCSNAPLVAIFATAFLFAGSKNLVYGIVIQGVCMIGSVAYLRKVQAGESCPVLTVFSRFSRWE